MNRIKYHLLFILPILFVATHIFATVVYSQPVAPSNPPEVPAPNYQRIILKWKKFTPSFVRNNILKQFTVQASSELLLDRTIIIQLPISIAETTQQLANSFWIEYAETDLQAQKFDYPNDPEYSEQWGILNTKLDQAWQTTTGTSSIDIAIVDTGIQRNHPDLQSKVTKRANFTWWYNDDDGDGHGTHVAGIASAITDNNTGIAGACPQCRLYSIKSLDNNGYGYHSWIANGIVWAVDQGAEIINLSLGGSSSTTLKRAIDYAEDNGVVVVAASGNQGGASPKYPANYTSVISVGAIDQNLSKPGWSNYGTWVDLAAPGVNILSTFPRDNYVLGSGTSMATPFVTGIAALIKAQHSEWTTQQIRAQLLQTAESIVGTGSYWKYGLVDACAALDCISNQPEPTLTLTPTTSQPTSTPTPILPTATPTPTNTSTPTPTPLSPTITPTPIQPTNTPTPAPPTSTPIPPTNTPIPTQPTNTPIPSDAPDSASPTPSTPQRPTPPEYPDLPWWCQYVPDHWTCQ